MDLSFLIPSKTRRTVLAYFVENPKATGGVRELAREMGLAPQLAYRELVNLESWGFLFSSKRGNQRAFRLNEKFYLLLPLRDLLIFHAREQNREYKVVNTYKLKDVVKRLSKIPVPSDLVAGLLAQRTKPRAYEEEKLLQKYK